MVDSLRVHAKEALSAYASRPRYSVLLASTPVQELTQKALQERVGATCGERSVKALTYAAVC